MSNIANSPSKVTVMDKYRSCVQIKSTYASVNQVSIDSNNGLSPIQRQAII